MASEIRVNQIQNRSGLGTVTVGDTGFTISGIVSATSYRGDGSQLTGVGGELDITSSLFV